MSPTGEPTGKNRKDFNQSVVLGAVVGQVGCLTLVFVLAALFGGLWLDNYLDTRPIFTVILMIASVPITLVAMFWIVRKATARLQTNNKIDSANTLQGGDQQ